MHVWPGVIWVNHAKSSPNVRRRGVFMHDSDKAAASAGSRLMRLLNISRHGLETKIVRQRVVAA